MSLQIRTEKLSSSLASVLWCLLSNARQDAVAYLLYKDEIGSVESTYAIDSKFSFNKEFGLISCLMETIVLESTSESVQQMYKEVVAMNSQINVNTPIKG